GLAEGCGSERSVAMARHAFESAAKPSVHHRGSLVGRRVFQPMFGAHPGVARPVLMRAQVLMTASTGLNQSLFFLGGCGSDWHGGGAGGKPLAVYSVSFLCTSSLQGPSRGTRSRRCAHRHSRHW